MRKNAIRIGVGLVNVSLLEMLCAILLIVPCMILIVVLGCVKLTEWMWGDIVHDGRDD